MKYSARKILPEISKEKFVHVRHFSNRIASALAKLNKLKAKNYLWKKIFYAPHFKHKALRNRGKIHPFLNEILCKKDKLAWKSTGLKFAEENSGTQRTATCTKIKSSIEWHGLLKLKYNSVRPNTQTDEISNSSIARAEYQKSNKKQILKC